MHSSIIRASRWRVVASVVSGLIILLGAPASTPAAPLRTFFVAPTGNDAAAGSSANPWRTLQKAANTVRAGDLVIVRAGTYAGLDLSTSGTASDPIIFQADPGAVVNAPNPRTSDGINLEGASYVVIDGFAVTGLPRAGIRTVTNHHVTIRNNTADLNGRWGILSGFSDDLLIENNVTSRSQVEHGIYVSNSGDRPVIRGNVSWGNRANGIHMNGDLSQGGDGVISNALVEGNTIYENGRGGGSGINCDGVRDSRIQNNLLFDNHASGISLYRIDGGDGSRNNVIAHNTIVQATDGRWAINIQNASTGNRLRNNILYNQHSFRGSISLSADSLPGFTSDYNVVMERFTLDDGGSVLTLAQWRSATAQDTHSFVASPAQLFVSAAGHDYHLIANSPARDAGLTLAEVTRDIAGTPRPVGPASDIGAFELADATLVAAVLPSSRSVQVNVPATAFATVIAAGPGAPTGCTIAAATPAPMSYTYQTTNPSTNAVTGTPNAPFNMAAGSFQTFVLALTPTAPFPPTDVPFNVQCANTGPAAIISGLNTLLMSASDTPVPDIVALAATMTHDGIVNIPGLSGVGAFAVGTVNLGRTGSIAVSVTTGAATLPVSILVCQTDPATGACITGMASTVLTTIPAGGTPTFAIFVTGLGNVPFNPAANRVFVRFTDAGGVVRGATSVAIRTQ